MKDNKNLIVKTSSKGLYVYCLSSEDAKIETINARGIEFGEKMYLYSFKDIRALVSEIDLNNFNEKVIKDKLQHSTEWTAKNVLEHHKVIAEFNKSYTVIPLKFGVVFKTTENLLSELKENYQKYTALLSWLKNKQEWGVKIYVDWQKFINQLRKRDQEILAFEKKKEGAPEGIRWYIDKKIDVLINQKLDKKTEHYLSKIVNKLKRDAEKVIINNPLRKDLTNKDAELILNAACLVKTEKIKPLEENWQKFFKAFEQDGLKFEMTGPWPPYNFVEKNFVGTKK